MRQYLCCMSPWDFEYNAYQPAGCNFNAPLGLMEQNILGKLAKYHSGCTTQYKSKQSTIYAP